MTDAPEYIWATIEEDDISLDELGEVYAQQVPDGMTGSPIKYARADLLPAKDATVKQLVEVLSEDVALHGHKSWQQRRDAALAAYRETQEKTK